MTYAINILQNGIEPEIKKGSAPRKAANPQPNVTIRNPSLVEKDGFLSFLVIQNMTSPKIRIIPIGIRKLFKRYNSLE